MRISSIYPPIDTRRLPASAVLCPKCGCWETLTIRSEIGPHYAREECAGCGRFRKWIPKPERAAGLRPARHRDLVKRFGHGFCELCLRPEKDLPAALEGHHIVEFSQGGESTRDNIQILCTNCHGIVHRIRRIAAQVPRTKLEGQRGGRGRPKTDSSVNDFTKLSPAPGRADAKLVEVKRLKGEGDET